MKINIHKADDRGGANYGWLNTKYSFSFSDYYNPERMGFGKIRVLNDDIIAPGAGFGTHPHDNMEIITIPLSGELAHKDSTGSEEVITPGQIQVMSAGSGIMHSEYNHSQINEAKLFQIWIETAQQDAPPRHATKNLDLGKNQLTKIVSGDKNEDALFIYQDASIWLGEFDQDIDQTFVTKKDRGVFIMIIEGVVEIAGTILKSRDEIEIEETEEINLSIKSGSKILIIDTLL